MSIVAARDIPDEIAFDICIIGAGACGLTIASNFLDARLSVGLLESGDASGQPMASEPGEPAASGLAYAHLATSRLKGVGGSTQSLGWGGLCKPLDAQDFVERPWVANSGWPFGLDALLPFYDRARETLGLGPLDALGARRDLFAGRSSVIAADTVELCRHYRLGHHLKGPIERSQAVRLMTGATVLALEHDPSGNHIRSALCVDAADKQFRVTARHFVLAAGGIENARLMMISNNRAGRPEPLVGRYFMDHPRFTLGTLVPANNAIRKVFAGMDRIRIARRQRIARKFGLDGERQFRLNGLTLPLAVQAREGLLNYRAWVEPCYPGQDNDAFERMKLALLDDRDTLILNGAKPALKHLLKGMGWTKAMHVARPAALARTFHLQHFIEPEPLADSAVTLSDKTDRHGLPRVSVRWQVSGTTRDSLRRTIGLLQGELQRTGLGRLDVAEEEWERLDRPMWTWHHMGTTRMSEDAKKGVVDADCRVHGLANLFIAGSSVFPTAGNDTPTMTIIALAHRLSDHLVRLMTLV